MERKAVDAFLAAQADFPGKKVLVTMEPLSQSYLDSLERSVTVWDREVLGAELGRARQGRAGAERGPIDELLATDFPKFLSIEQMGGLQDTAVGERIVRPVISVEDVREMAKDAVAGFRQHLDLVPYYVFSYTCPLFMDGQKVKVERGALSVNGLTQKVEPWAERSEVVYTLDTDHKRLDAAIDDQDARRAAKRELMRVNTFDQEHVLEQEHVILTEKKPGRPRDEEIDLQGRGVFYIPVWFVEGVHGAMSIDASTGRVVSEDHYAL